MTYVCNFDCLQSRPCSCLVCSKLLSLLYQRVELPSHLSPSSSCACSRRRVECAFKFRGSMFSDATLSHFAFRFFFLSALYLDAVHGVFHKPPLSQTCKTFHQWVQKKLGFPVSFLLPSRFLLPFFCRFLFFRIFLQFPSYIFTSLSVNTEFWPNRLWLPPNLAKRFCFQPKHCVFLTGKTPGTCQWFKADGSGPLPWCGDVLETRH